MPKLRKPSVELRRRKAKIGLLKYRERHGDYDRVRNKLMLALRRTDEKYYVDSLIKNRITRRRQRYSKKYKERRLLNMPKTEVMPKHECKLKCISAETNKKYMQL